MDALLKNAADSIRIGVEDYETREPARALSSVRNLHAGLVLLAKSVLVHATPNAREDEVIAVAYEPQQDGVGGVRYVPKGSATIGLREIVPRFKSFGLNPSKEVMERLESLRRVRNAVEHRYPEESPASLRQTVAATFVVAAEFFRLGGLDPVEVLGEAWSVMLDVKEVYAKELAACEATFRSVEWTFSLPDDLDLKCPVCLSDLVEQVDPHNKVQDDVRGKCRSCGSELDGEEVVESLVGSAYWARDYTSIKDGGEPVLQTCPSCFLETYLNEFDVDGKATGCVACGFTLGTCFRCGNPLTPDDRYDDGEDLCGYCGSRIAKGMER